MRKTTDKPNKHVLLQQTAIRRGRLTKAEYNLLCSPLSSHARKKHHLAHSAYIQLRLKASQVASDKEITDYCDSQRSWGWIPPSQTHPTGWAQAAAMSLNPGHLNEI